MNELKGMGVALITPFDAHGNVDHDALKRVVQHQLDNGTDYLVVLGTTAESATLSAAEKKEVISTITETNAGTLPLVIGIGGNNTRVILEEIASTDLDPFAAILSVSPAYSKPTQEGIYQHFKAIATSTEKPIVLYNVPGRTASNMSVDTVVRLANDFDNIVGIKEAAGDLPAVMKMIQRTPDDFLVISGDDMIANAMTLAGGAGVISVIGQTLAKDFSEMIRLALAGEVKASYDLHYKVADSIDLIFEQGNPAGIKNMFEHMGICQQHLRLPLVPVNEDLSSRIKSFWDRTYLNS